MSTWFFTSHNDITHLLFPSLTHILFEDDVCTFLFYDDICSSWSVNSSNNGKHSALAVDDDVDADVDGDSSSGEMEEASEMFSVEVICTNKGQENKLQVLS